MKVYRIESPLEINHLMDHIHERTFGRLHDLNIEPTSDGRIHVSAVAHSRFVGQLAEWAVLERVSPDEVDLSIRICLSSSRPHDTRFTEVQK
jgi:hypothetical protein